MEDLILIFVIGVAIGWFITQLVEFLVGERKEKK